MTYPIRMLVGVASVALGVIGAINLCAPLGAPWSYLASFVLALVVGAGNQDMFRRPK